MRSFVVKRASILLPAIISLILTAAVARAAEKGSPQAVTATAEPYAEAFAAPVTAPKSSSGLWKLGVSTGLGFSMTSNYRVVGRQDGENYAVGGHLTGTSAYNKGGNSWKSAISVREAFLKSIQLPVWINSDDQFLIGSSYQFTYLDLFGPFVMAGLKTSILAHEDVRPDPVEYAIARKDGSIDVIIGDRLPLTDPFKPLILSQSSGMFIKTPARKKINSEFKLGPGAEEVFADGQFSISDKSATRALDVVELSDYIIAGASVSAGFGGELVDKLFSYEVTATALMPIYDSTIEGDRDRGYFDSTNIDIKMTLTFQLTGWLSINYHFSAIRQPQLYYYWQIRNVILATAAFDIDNSR